MIEHLEDYDGQTILREGWATCVSNRYTDSVQVQVGQDSTWPELEHVEVVDNTFVFRDPDTASLISLTIHKASRTLAEALASPAHKLRELLPLTTLAEIEGFRATHKGIDKAALISFTDGQAITQGNDFPELGENRVEVLVTRADGTISHYFVRRDAQ